MNISIAVASLLETITVKEAEKDSILASLTAVPLGVRKRPVASQQAAMSQQPVMSQQAALHKWSSPEFVSFGKPPKRATSAML